MTELITFTSVIILGLTLGSFSTCLSYRLPQALLNREQDVLKFLSLPRSHCLHCNTPLKVRNLIPIISWLFQRGQTHCCKTSIGLRYPSIELTMTLLTLYAYFRFGLTLEALASVTLSFLMLNLLVTDIETLLLPDQLTLGGIWTGLLFCIYLTPNALPNHIWGALFGYCSLWLVYQVHFRLTGREGLGYGDFKLLALIGAWCGLSTFSVTLLLACTLAIIGYAYLRVLNRIETSSVIPFGPALCVAGWASYHYPNILINLISP